MEIVLPQGPRSGQSVAPVPVVYGGMTPHMAASYLHDAGITTRSFSETLQTMYPHDDLIERLVRFYVIAGTRANNHSLTRRFENWMKNRNCPTNREDIFKIAYALKLDESQLDYLLGLTTGYCIQYRDGYELVLAWFLRKGYGYREALEFHASLPKYEPHETMSPVMHTHETRRLKAELTNIRTLDDLHAFYLLNMHHFGTQHLRGHAIFDRFLSQLIQPTSLLTLSESTYSIERIMQEYLSMHMPTTRNRKSLTQLQRIIKKEWPNATTIKSVLNHTKDVPRKLLILLYVVTENCGIPENSPALVSAPGFVEASASNSLPAIEQRMNDHWWTLNAILRDCGMAALDPRNAFDWLVLYAISVKDDEPMSKRMEQVIDELFALE